jgi:hypothetical protein
VDPIRSWLKFLKDWEYYGIIGKWDIIEEAGYWGYAPERRVVSSPFLSFCFLAAMRWASLLHHKLSTMILSFPTGPEAEKSSNHGPKPLKQWAKLNFPSFLLVFLGDFYKVEVYLFIIVLSLLPNGNNFILSFQYVSVTITIDYETLKNFLRIMRTYITWSWFTLYKMDERNWRCLICG